MDLDCRTRPRAVLAAIVCLFAPVVFAADECDAPGPGWIFCDDFESGDMSRWIDVSSIAVTADAAKVHHGGHAAQLHYRQGSSGAGWAWKKGLGPDGPDRSRQYIRWWQKWEDGFVWQQGSGDQKMFMLDALEPQDAWGQTANWKLYVHLVSHAVSGVEPDELFVDRFIWGGTDQWSGQWKRYPQNRPKILYRTAQWECSEIELVHNTPGEADGVLRMWINDTLVAEYTDVRFRDDPISWNAIQLNAWYGDPGVPRDQYSWVDQVVVSSERIGCSGAGGGGGGLSAPAGLRRTDVRLSAVP